MQPTELLNSLGLAEYIQAFEENAIDAESLLSLSDADLKELGVAKLGHRKKILEAIASLASAPTPHAVGAVADMATQLPNIVAFPLREYASEEHPVAKLWAMCDTTELLLRLVVVVFVSRQREHGGLSEKTAESLSSLVESPTLGAWFVMAQTLAKDADDSLRAAADFVEGPLRDLLYGPDKPGTAETSLLRLRNRLAHGGGLTRREAARLLQLWQPKFDGTVNQLSWLSGWELVGRDKEGNWLSLAGAEPATSNFAPEERPHEVDAVWIKIGPHSFPLWPLAVFGTAKAPGSSKAGAEDLTQIYTRRESVRLAYTPIGAEGIAQSESGPSGFEAFKALFQLDRPRSSDFSVADFAAEMRKDAAQAVGRDNEVAAIVAAVHEIDQGVLWISGAAGTGKSFLVAKAHAELLDRKPGDNTAVLAYRFRTSDQARCSREALATFLEERLAAAGACVASESKDAGTDAANRISDCLGRVKAGWRIVIFLDGLDEIARHDEKFAEEIPLGIRPANVLWVCSGRSETGLAKVMGSLGAVNLFPQGLPPMSNDDIRAMVLEKIGPLRKKLLAGDEEKGDSVINPFIDLVTVRAAGLPLYVKYVIGDVLSGKYRVLDGQEDLPDSLHAYHEELLRRLAVGDLQAVVTPLAATLACAHEPLSVREIEAVLVYRKLLTSEGATALVEEGLAATASMLSSAPDPEGETGFTLFHQSLRDHMRTSEQMRQSMTTGIAAMAELSLGPNAPESLRNYLLRCGVRHLLEAGRHDDAQKLLLDLDHLGRMANLGIEAETVAALWRELGDEDRSASYARILQAYLQSPTNEKLSVARFVVSLSMAAGWVREATTIAELSSGCHEALLGPNTEASIKAASAYARCIFNRGRLTESRDLIKDLFDRSQEFLGSEHPETVHCMGSLARVMASLGDQEASEKLHRRALMLREKILGKSHPATLRSVRALGEILCMLGRFQESEALLASALDGFTKRCGPLHNDTLLSLRAMGQLLGATHRHDAACELLASSSEETARSLGDNHPQTLDAVFWHARQLAKCGKAEVAELMLRNTLGRVEKVFGPDSRHRLDVVNELANCLARLERLDEAEALYRECALEFKQRYGKQSPTYLVAIGNLARVLTDKGYLDEAGGLCLECVSGYKLLHGTRHPAYLDSLNVLGRVARDKDDLTEAERCFREEYNGKLGSLGLRHKSTLAAASYLGHTLQLQSKYEQASPFFLLAAEGFEIIGGPNDDHALFNYELLLRALYRSGDLSDAERVADKLLNAQSLKHGPTSAFAAKAMSLAAPIKAKLGKLSDAENLYRGSLDIRRSDLGDCHPDVLRTAVNLGELFRTQGRCDEESALYSGLLESVRVASNTKMTAQQDKIIGKMRNRLNTLRQSEVS